MAENQLEVLEKTRHSGTQEESAELTRAIHEMEDAEQAMYDADDKGTYGEAREAEADFEAASSRVEELQAAERTLHGEAKDGLVLPGGKNYRELVLMLPRKKGEKPFSGLEEHFPEDNIIASIRFIERIDADGKKMLFIEEIQSDWQAKGHKKGFLTAQDKVARESAQTELAALEGQFRKAKEETGRYLEETKSARERTTPAMVAHDPKLKRLMERENHLRREFIKAREQLGRGVDAAPFVSEIKGGKAVSSKKWQRLALKRMLRWASENGFERLGIIRGEDTASR